MAAKKRAVPEQSYAIRCGMEFGEVAEGWTRDGWKVELERKAMRCEAVNPGMAQYYRRWADVLAGKVGTGRE